MIDLIVVDEFDRTMFKIQVQDYIAVAMGEKIVPKFDSNQEYLGRSIDWLFFKEVMDRAY